MRQGEASKRLFFGRFLVLTSVAAILAVLLSLAYLSAEPGPMPLGEILTAIFGVGLTVIVAGVLAGLMFISAHNEQDDTTDN